jgi:glycosyltransferase involved in cell wall biosynthesis
MQRFFQGQADTVLAVSAVTKRQLISDLLLNPERVHVAPTGVPPDFFVDKATTSDELRLLFLGSLSAEKNPLVAVEVAEQVGADRSVQLRLVGAGPLESEIAARISSGSSSTNIETTGSVADVMPHLEWANLLLLPSRTEGLPGAVLEAGAAGVPTLAFDVGGVRETMVDGTSGLIVAAGDTAAMVEAARQLAADPARLHNMGREQQNYVRDHFTLEAAIDRFDRLLTTALETDS